MNYIVISLRLTMQIIFLIMHFVLVCKNEKMREFQSSSNASESCLTSCALLIVPDYPLNLLRKGRNFHFCKTYKETWNRTVICLFWVPSNLSCLCCFNAPNLNFTFFIHRSFYHISALLKGKCSLISSISRLNKNRITIVLVCTHLEYCIWYATDTRKNIKKPA